MTPHTATFTIEGMSCGHCVRAVQQALADVESVEIDEVRVGEARVRFDPERVDRAGIARAIQEEGYAVTGGA